MSQENVELVRATFQAFNRGGIEAALGLLSPDVVWYTTDRWLERPAYRGHDGMRELDAAFAENFDGWGYELSDVQAAGDRVVALCHMTGRIRNSGQAVSQPLGLLVRVDESGLGEIRAFASWEAALTAADLDAQAPPPA